MSFFKNIFINLLRIHSSFFTYFLFFKYFKFVNSKIADFEIRWDRIRRISVKFAEFVNAGIVASRIITVVRAIQAHLHIRKMRVFSRRMQEEQS
jgi:hypothetical protein